MQAVWLDLVSGYTSHEGLKAQLWQEILAAYTEKSRHYHNLQHLAQLFSLAQSYRTLLEDPDSLKFAIFYHDLIYKAFSKTNEEDSAALAANRLQQLGASPAKQEKVRQMILATKTHAATPDADTELLLDFDLSILAAPWEDYLTYTRQIRKEYNLVPYFLYKKGRKKVLNHFLELSRIYKTEPFFKQHEAVARQNLQKELELLNT